MGMCEPLLGLPELNVHGVADMFGEMLRVYVETRVSRTGCGRCGVWSPSHDRASLDSCCAPPSIRHVGDSPSLLVRGPADREVGDLRRIRRSTSRQGIRPRRPRSAGQRRRTRLRRHRPGCATTTPDRPPSDSIPRHVGLRLTTSGPRPIRLGPARRCCFFRPPCWTVLLAFTRRRCRRARRCRWPLGHPWSVRGRRSVR